MHSLTEQDGPLPPIVVHRATMRVIDGMHRLRAAERRGEEEIEVCFFDGIEEDAFLLAVKLNEAHGLPLSVDDRAAAAARIIKTRPQWSDRRIAEATGLAATTIGAIRRRSTVSGPQLNVRIGKDGKARPLSAADGRRRAHRILVDNPRAPLREVARTAGVALATARDVRARVDGGQDPVPPKVREAEARAAATRRRHREEVERQLGLARAESVLRRLRRDPSLRLTAVGRTLLQLLSLHAVSAEEWQRLVAGVPPHVRQMVAEVARVCAQRWLDLARRMEEPVA
ncbi:ParB/RepB/Spo0J family partition protein [Streptomyces sioyaensis]|uniref:ParB/RepB/Spo0J family partition protein n=1 Tax=Streptomyces sioyaensis TaxID=67364 RepID=UPI0037A1894F